VVVPGGRTVDPVVGDSVTFGAIGVLDGQGFCDPSRAGAPTQGDVSIAQADRLSFRDTL
jgi:hypothetical protein